jgi:hypothetical protein
MKPFFAIVLGARRAFFVLALMVSLGGAAQGAIGLEYFQVDKDPSGTGEPLEAIVVRNSVLFDALPTAQKIELQKKADEWNRKGRDWSFEQFRKAYPEYTDAEFEKLKEADPLQDPRATRIILMKGDGSREIIGSLKAIYDDGISNLPMERAEYFGPLKKPEPEVREFPLLLPPTGKLHPVTSVVGGRVQLMEFVAVQRDLNAILVSLLEMELFLREPGDFQRVAIDGLDIETLDAIENNLKVLRKDYRDGRFAMRPQSYLLYCDERLVSYYQRLGFKDFIQKGKLHGMSLDRRSFSEITFGSSPFAGARAKLEQRGGVKWAPSADPHYLKKTNERVTFWPVKNAAGEPPKEFLVDTGPGTPVMHRPYDKVRLSCSEYLN